VIELERIEGKTWEEWLAFFQADHPPQTAMDLTASLFNDLGDVMIVLEDGTTIHKPQEG